MYVGLRGVLGAARIVDASHDNTKILRTATVSQKHKTMVFTFQRWVLFFLMQSPYLTIFFFLN